MPLYEIQQRGYSEAKDNKHHFLSEYFFGLLIIITIEGLLVSSILHDQFSRFSIIVIENLDISQVGYRHFNIEDN